MSDEVKALLVAFFGGGGLVKLLDFIAQRGRTRLDARREHAQVSLEETRWTWQEAQDIVNRYREDMTTLRSELAVLRSELATVRTENGELKQKNYLLQREVDALTTEVGRLRAEVQTLARGK